MVFQRLRLERDKILKQTERKNIVSILVNLCVLKVIFLLKCVMNGDQETETLDPVCHYGKSNLKEVLRVGKKF